jgi:hypothetical protein
MRALQSVRRISDVQEIRSRAAEVRKRWSSAERRRRTGLPPDTPLQLCQYVLGHSIIEWQTAPDDPTLER